MTSKEMLLDLVRHVNLQDCENKVLYYNQIEKDLDLLESIKEVFKKVTYEPEYSYEEEDENGMIPIKYASKVKIAEDFDRELFRQVLEQCGFEIKEK